MKEHIRKTYEEERSISRTADKLGIDPKSVAKYVKEIGSSKEDNAKVGGPRTAKGQPSTPGGSVDTNKHDDSTQSSALVNGIRRPSFAEVVERLEQGDSMMQIIINLGLTFEEAEKHRLGYWQLKQMDKLNALYMKNKERFESILELDTLMKKMGLDPERYADLMAKVSSVEQVKMEYQSNLFTAEKEREIMINAGKDIAVLEMQKQDLSSSVAQLKNEKRNVENATSAHKMRLDSLKAEEPKIRQSIQSARNELERIKSLAQATQEDVTNIIMQTTDSLLLDKKVLFTLGVVAIRDAVREDPGFILQLNPVARGDVPRDDQLSSAYRRFQAAFDRNYELLVQEITRRTYQQMLNSQATDTNG